MEIRIPYPLSQQTRPEYETALGKVQASKDQGGKVVNVEIQEIAPGQFIAVIVMEQPV